MKKDLQWRRWKPSRLALRFTFPVNSPPDPAQLVDKIHNKSVLEKDYFEYFRRFVLRRRRLKPETEQQQQK